MTQKDQNLRQEISNRLTFLTEQKEKFEYDECTEYILKLIEKRIDQFIEQQKQLQEECITKEDFQGAANLSVSNYTLILVKEMLK